jgi:hypothetical protein
MQPTFINDKRIPFAIMQEPLIRKADSSQSVKRCRFDAVLLRVKQPAVQRQQRLLLPLAFRHCQGSLSDGQSRSRVSLSLLQPKRKQLIASLNSSPLALRTSCLLIVALGIGSRRMTTALTFNCVSPYAVTKPPQAEIPHQRYQR